jgi:hypothetical protein
MYICIYAYHISVCVAEAAVGVAAGAAGGWRRWRLEVIN